MTQPTTGPAPLVVWRVLDGKPGHENQSLGLVEALARLVPVQVHTLAAPAHWRGLLNLLLGRCPAGAGLPDPDLLIGAGHRTHAVLLGCRRKRGGRAVVLMRPSLPLGWFDLCLAPPHDMPAGDDRVLLTQGVLNAVTPAEPDPARPGLVLIGGPSNEYGWRTDELIARLKTIIDRAPRPWLLVTSRRTPADTEQALAGLVGPGVNLVPWRDAPHGWLASQLPGAPVAWVSADSVSMLYEALTAGAACGVLPVPLKRAGRVAAGLDALLAAGVVSSFDQWQDGRPLHPPPQPFDEATRCARLILDRWFAN